MQGWRSADGSGFIEVGDTASGTGGGTVQRTGPVPAGLIEGAGSSGMLAGFRPEHVDPANGRADGARFDAVVEVVEYLGDEQLVHLRLRDTPLLAKLDIEQRVAPGEQSSFRIPPDKLHLFDAETEQALRA
jgi:multiple sugar transport system ATP-binding protein